MRVKGKNLHIFPNDTGWCVVSEANRNITQHFKTEEEAMAYGRLCAVRDESEVLLHTAPCGELDTLSTVCLPQREYFPGQGWSDRDTEPDRSTPATKA